MSSANKRQILEDARKFAAMFSGFMSAAEVLGEIGSLERATDEARARWEKLRKEETELMAKHANMRAEAEQTAQGARDQAELVRAQAQEQAVALIEKAKNDANIEADRIIGRAHDAAMAMDRQIAERRKAVAELDETRAKLEAELDKLASRHDELMKAMAEKSVEHDRLVRAHRKFLESIGASL